MSDQSDPVGTEAPGAPVSPSPRALPPSAIDPADLMLLMPSLSEEDAERYCQLATLAVQAAIWPNAIPNPPNPPAPMYAALLSIASRFAAAGETGGGMPVLSESIGSYSYRLATPPTLDAVFALTDAERAALAPWMRGGAYELDVTGDPSGWPVDWWQRDYDNAVARADALGMP